VLELALRPGSSYGALFVYLDLGRGYGYGPSNEFRFDRGDSILRFEVPRGLLRARFDVQIGGHACISALRIVRYAAR
jgi:hypothetical protein